MGELTVKGANLKSPVHVQDFHFQFSNNVVTSATIVIKDFKHNTTRHPFSVFLERAEGSTLCPVTYLQRYLSAVYDICRLQTADRRLQTTDHRPQIADCKLKDTKNLPNKGDTIKNITSCESEKVAWEQG